MRRVYGISAEFTSAEAVIDAARRARDLGFSRMEVYSPFPLEGLEDVVPHRNWLPPVVLAGGITGTLTAFVLQEYIAVWDYPINVGGRPLNSLPSFIVIMFELTVLFAALAAFFGSLFFCGLPKPYHSVANAPDFEQASREKFFLCIDHRDPLYDPQRTSEFLLQLNPERVDEIAA